MPIRIEDNALIVDAPTFVARFEGAALVSLCAKAGNVEFLRVGGAFPVELYYVNEDDLAADKHQQITLLSLGEWAARIVLAGADSERELLVRLDPDTGDLCVTPSGQSARRGLAAVRWNLAYAPEVQLVLPCINGLLVARERPFPAADRFAWPYRWNAQLTIAERQGQTLMLHAEDTDCRFKALKLQREEDGLVTLGYESEQVGPLWDNRAAGGVEWRLNVYDGGWQRPAQRYHDWLNRTYQLERKRAHRPEWVQGIGLCIIWAHTDANLLAPLARTFPPDKTLIHLASWRTDKYDVNYPEYLPTTEACSFMAQANAMGFHIMPHFNYFSCYNDHPLFLRLRDWQIRDPYKNEPQGWYWPPDTHDYTRMGYIHPGLALWRRTLIDRVRATCAELSAPAAFIDQTLCTWNTDNGLVENMTTVQGLRQLQEEFVAVQPDMVLAGEGLNEISFQRQCFAQAHIHDGWRESGLGPEHVEAAHPICSFLWQGHTRMVGYYHLHKDDKDMDLGIEVYRRMGVMPSLGPSHFLGEGEVRPLDDARVARVIALANEDM